MVTEESDVEIEEVTEALGNSGDGGGSVFVSSSFECLPADTDILLSCN